jgi:hypothetical protein
MAHYALINDENIVVEVISGVDEDIIQIDLDGSEVGGSSEAWEAFYASRPWFAGLYCKRTSYNARIRKNYAGIGSTYDAENDAFIPARCHDVAVLDQDKFVWNCDYEAHPKTV